LFLKEKHVRKERERFDRLVKRVEMEEENEERRRRHLEGLKRNANCQNY